MPMTTADPDDNLPPTDPAPTVRAPAPSLPAWPDEAPTAVACPHPHPTPPHPQE